MLDDPKSIPHRHQITPMPGLKRVSTKVEKKVQDLLVEILVLGFAVAKEIATLRKLKHGEMSCPLCGQVLRFVFSPENNHFHARCERKDCIHFSE